MVLGLSFLNAPFSRMKNHHFSHSVSKRSGSSCCSSLTSSLKISIYSFCSHSLLRFPPLPYPQPPYPISSHVTYPCSKQPISLTCSHPHFSSSPSLAFTSAVPHHLLSILFLPRPSLSSPLSSFLAPLPPLPPSLPRSLAPITPITLVSVSHAGLPRRAH